MGLTFAGNSRLFGRNFWHLTFRVTLLISVWLAGCNNTCLTFTSKPPTGSLTIKASDPAPTCTLTKANGIVRVALRARPKCNSCAQSDRFQRVFVTLQGIEVHPSATADEASPDWQELAPQLAQRPLQVDFMSETNPNAVESIGIAVVIPAGMYRRVRLRFMPNPPASAELLPEKNACGSAGFHCAILTDGRILPLVLDSPAHELRITTERIADGFLLIPPDTETEIVIELSPSWSLFSSAHDGIRVVPTLTGKAEIEQDRR